MELLAQPKTPRPRRGAKKEPLKVFDASPVTGNKVQLLDGRYGPYVTDGETNASLPKGASIEELTFAEALDLLAARAASGPPKKKPRAKRRRRRNAAPKKAATKRRPAKKAGNASRRRKRRRNRRAIRHKDSNTASKPNQVSIKNRQQSNLRHCSSPSAIA